MNAVRFGKIDTARSIQSVKPRSHRRPTLIIITQISSRLFGFQLHVQLLISTLIEELRGVFDGDGSQTSS